MLLAKLSLWQASWRPLAVSNLTSLSLEEVGSCRSQRAVRFAERQPPQGPAPLARRRGRRGLHHFVVDPGPAPPRPPQALAHALGGRPQLALTLQAGVVHFPGCEGGLASAPRCWSPPLPRDAMSNSQLPLFPPCPQEPAGACGVSQQGRFFLAPSAALECPAWVTPKPGGVG